MIASIIEAVLMLVEKWAAAYVSKRAAARRQADAPLTRSEELADINNLPRH